MKTLLGKTDIADDNHAYFHFAFQDCSVDSCICQADSKRNLSNSVFKHLESCPAFIDCQSYDQWRLRFFSKLNFHIDVMKLYFLPIGPFPEFIHHYQSPCGKKLFQLLSDYLNVILLPEKSIEEFNCKQRKHFLTKKDQCLVSDFFPTLRSSLPNDGCCIVALSWCDLYPSEQLNFLLGQGSYEYFSCISSFGRFDPTSVLGFQGKTDGIPPEDLKDISSVDSSLLYKLIKILSHEVCHVFGLHHCAVFSCLMNESKSTQEAIEQPMVLCPICMKKIYHVTTNYAKSKRRFQVRTHLAALLHFFRVVFPEDQNVSDENHLTTMQRVISTTKWIENVLNQLSSAS